MRSLFGYSVLHASTACQNNCLECPLKGYEPCIAELGYMIDVARFLKSRSIFPVLDVAGKDISYNPSVPEFLAICKKIGLITTTAIGTPHSVKIAKEIFQLVDHPRISLDGPRDFSDTYRGEDNYDSFVQLIEIAQECGVLSKLKIIFTAIPGQNVKKGLLSDVLETVRKLGRGQAKLLVNPINANGYSIEEWQILKELGRQAEVVFSKATQWLHYFRGETKGCLCQAPKHLTFGVDQTLIAPCGLLPLKKIDLRAGFENALMSGEWQAAAAQCGNHPACAQCWATCYHLAGVFLKPSPAFLLAHLPSVPPIQAARDRILALAG